MSPLALKVFPGHRAICLATTFPSLSCSWTWLSSGPWRMKESKRRTCSLLKERCFCYFAFLSHCGYGIGYREEDSTIKDVRTGPTNYQSNDIWGQKVEDTTRGGNPQPLAFSKHGSLNDILELSHLPALDWFMQKEYISVCLSLCFWSVFIIAISQDPNYFGCPGLSWHDVLLIQNSSQYISFWAYRTFAASPVPFFLLPHVCPCHLQKWL